MTHFELAQFQEKVLNEYEVIRQLGKKELYFEELADAENKGLPNGWLGRFFLRVGIRFGKAGFRQVNECKAVAKNLLSRSDVRILLCSHLRTVIEDEFVSEEHIIKEIVRILVEEPVRERFSLPLKAELFALVSYELLHIGIRSYYKSKDVLCNK